MVAASDPEFGSGLEGDEQSAKEGRITGLLNAFFVIIAILSLGWLLAYLYTGFAFATGSKMYTGLEALEVRIAGKASASQWKELARAISRSRENSTLVLVGGEEGTAFVARKGESRGSNVSRPVASSTKWVVATVILCLVQDGVLSLASRPQDYLQKWTSDPMDARSRITLHHLLTFTSGLIPTHPCTYTQDPSLGSIELFWECVDAIHDASANMTSTPGSLFYYSLNHIQVAGAMAIKASNSSWSQLFDRYMAGVMPRNSVDWMPSWNWPQGNLVTSPDVYAKFLTALLKGNMLGGEIRRASWLDHTSDASYLEGGAGTLQPFFPNGEPRWHYSYGHWIECNPSSSSLAECNPSSSSLAECNPSSSSLASCDATVHSSVGASGFYPVIVRPPSGRTYWAIVAFESEINARGGALLGAMTDAVMHFRELRGAVEGALSHSRT